MLKASTESAPEPTAGAGAHRRSGYRDQDAGRKPPQRAPDTIALPAEGPHQRVAAVLTAAGLKVLTRRSAELLLEEPPEPDPRLVVLWLADTSSGSLVSVQRLAERFAAAPVLVICPEIKRWGARAALKAGAAGVVYDDELETALVPTARALWAGQACIPRGHWQQLEPPALSSREKQVLGLAVMGYMNSQIAGRLFLAESTVKSHLSSVFGKLGVRSRHEAADLVVDFERGLGIDLRALAPVELNGQTPPSEPPGSRPVRSPS